MSDCIFCSIPKENYVFETTCFYGIYDKYPVSPGHLLLIPKAHREDWFSLNAEEKAEFQEAFELGKSILEKQFHPDGYNFGINQGEAAGQTIPHLHIHLIPRYLGDMYEPEGGVRGVIPEKRKYR